MQGLRADEAGGLHGLIEEDVHDPFGGVTVPLFGNGTRASMAVENRVRFLHDALRVGSYQHVGSDLARDGTSVLGRIVRHGIPKTVVSSWMPPLSVRTMRERATKPRKGR